MFGASQCGLQCVVAREGPTQGIPPFFATAPMLRSRSCSPSQEQEPQSDQGVQTHGIGRGASEQGPIEHGRISFVVPTHSFGFPKSRRVAGATPEKELVTSFAPLPVI